MGNKITGIIYKVTSPSGKIYIGKTERGFDVRKAKHIENARNGSTLLFSNAIRKYGELLKWEVIDTAEDSVSLSLLEISWIKYYGSFGEGYNGTIGGEGKRKYETKEEATATYKAYMKEYLKEYRQKPKSKSSHNVHQKEYRLTPKVKAQRKAYDIKYRQTPKRKAYSKSYEKSLKRKDYKKAYYLKNKQMNDPTAKTPRATLYGIPVFVTSKPQKI